MPEKKFLNYIFIEGAILTFTALCILIIPKITELSFGIMLSSGFIVYGIYKIINSVFNRNYLRGYVCEMLLGVFLFVIGVLLLLVPRISILWLIAMIGIYFLLESLQTSTFISQIRTMYNFWGCKYFSGGAIFLIGLLIIMALPAMSFWVVAMLSGLGFLIKGMSKIALYNSNR